MIGRSLVPLLFALGRLHLAMAPATTNSLPPIMTSSAAFWAKSISDAVFDMFKRASGWSTLNAEFDLALQEGQLQLLPVDGMGAMASFKSVFTYHFDIRKTSIQKLEKSAMDFEQQIPDDFNITRMDYNYVGNMVPENQTMLFTDPDFDSLSPVDFNSSYIQLSANRYYQDPKVLRELQWMLKLDPVYKKNYLANKKVGYQYIGSPYGIYSMYPGYLSWNTSDPNNFMYDVRLRPWYAAAASPPKDVMIIIDGTGSMIGEKFAIARLTAYVLVDTLQENDYFNVFYYSSHNSSNNSSNGTWESYFSNNLLVQATTQNKQLMQKAIDQKKITPAGYVSADDAVGWGLRDLMYSRSRNSTSSCRPIVMFISDGVEGTSIAADTIKKLKVGSKVVFYTYLVGETNNGVSTSMQNLACSSQGKFYWIRTISNVYDIAPDYMNVLMFPLALEGKSEFAFSAPYFDALVGTPLLSLSKPVFSNNSGYATESRLLGVFGTDMDLNIFLAEFPFWMLPIGSYGFVVNYYGHLLIHPKLLSKLSQVHQIPTILASEMELDRWKNRSVQMLRMMVTMNQGNTSYSAMYLYEEERRIVFRPMMYIFNALNGTPYTLFLVHRANLMNIRLTPGVYQILDLSILESSLENLESGMDISLMPWLYCDFDPPDSINPAIYPKYYPNATELAQFLRAREVDSCQPIFYDMLFCLQKLKDMTVRAWSVTTLTAYGITDVAVNTYGGVTKQWSSSGAFLMPDANTKTRYDDQVVDMIDGAIPTMVIMYSRSDPAVNSTELPFSITMGLPVIHQKEKVNPAVSAVAYVRMSGNSWTSMIRKLLRPFDGYACSSGRTKASCFLLSDNGYVLYSSEAENQTGLFLGDVDSNVMNVLLSVGVYTELVATNPLGICNLTFNFQSGSGSRNNWLLAGSILPICAGNSRYRLACLGLSLLVLAHEARAQDDSTLENVSIVQRTFCPQDFYAYSWNPNVLPIQGIIPCPLCNTFFVASIVPRTNIIMLVIDRPCNPACPIKPWSKMLKSVVGNISIKDYRVSSQTTIRKRPSSFCKHGMMTNQIRPCDIPSDFVDSSSLLGAPAAAVISTALGCILVLLHILVFP